MLLSLLVLLCGAVLSHLILLLMVFFLWGGAALGCPTFQSFFGVVVHVFGGSGLPSLFVEVLIASYASSCVVLISPCVVRR